LDVAAAGKFHALFERLIRHARALKKQKLPVALIGDYNVVPTDFDIHPTNPGTTTLSCSPRAARPISGSTSKAGPTPYVGKFKQCRGDLRGRLLFIWRRPIVGKENLTAAEDGSIVSEFC
jgi:exonuclease III